MDTCLCNLRQELKGKLLSGGKKINGKGRLPDKAIDSLQKYYGLATHRNVDNSNDMRKDIWAKYLHKKIS